MAKKISNFAIIMWTIIIIVIVLLAYSFYQINESKKDKMIYSMEENIKYYAKRCYLEEKCSSTMTLNDLYTNNYINEEVVNPVTKEVINLETKIIILDNDVQIIYK